MPRPSQQQRKKIVVLSGAGISAESGLGTFRDSGGLWEQYKIEEVATPEAWKKDKALVLDFYNARRRQAVSALPNAGHFSLKKLEDFYDVCVVTQNIDDLHERAGSSEVIHLHGEISKGKSVVNPNKFYPINGDIKVGDLAPDGHQMRPHVVWFGEAVPLLPKAQKVVEKADFLIVVGTSLNVYPAAALRYSVPAHAACFLVDPGDFNINDQAFIHYKGKASEQLPLLVNELIKNS